MKTGPKEGFSGVLGRRSIQAILFALIFSAAAQTAAFAQPEPGIEYEFTSNLEYRYRTSDVSIEPYAGKNGIDFYRDFARRPALLGLYLGLGDTQGLRVDVAANLRRQWSLERGFSFWNLPPFGVPGNPVAIENGIVELGVLSWNSPSVDISFGRQKIDYSDGLRGSLLPSPRLPFLDSFKLHGRIGSLGIDWLLTSIRGLQAIDKFDVKPNGVSSFTPGDTYFYGFENGSAWVDDTQYLGSPTAIVSALHRFTWDFEKFDMGLAAHVMYARRNNRFTVLDLMPVISWHQAVLLQINMSLVLDGRWEPFPGAWLAFQAGFDDINAGVVGVNDNDATTITALVIGGGYSDNTPSGEFSAYAEAGYTHYLWGNYDGAQNPPEDGNPFLRFIYRYPLDGGAVLLPMTSPYGPGALWFETTGEWKSARTGLGIGIDFLALSKNSKANLVDTPYYGDLSAIEGAPRVFFASLAAPLRWHAGDYTLNLVPEISIRNKTIFATLSAGAGVRIENRNSLPDSGK